MIWQCFGGISTGMRIADWLRFTSVSYFQRDRAAFFAMARRLALLKIFALAFPPLRPPMVPRATACGFLRSGGGASSGLPSICSPMACSTMLRATSIKSRFGLDRFGMAPSCHGSADGGSPVEIMLTQYPTAEFAERAEFFRGLVFPCGPLLPVVEDSRQCVLPKSRIFSAPSASSAVNSLFR